MLRVKTLWASYSRTLTDRILKRRSHGTLVAKEGFRLVVGSAKELTLYILVDEEDGLIADAKHCVAGESALIGAADTLCELLLRKNYDQAKRINADLLDHQEPLPAVCHPYLHRVLEALKGALEQCEGIPLQEGYVVTPVDLDHLQEGELPAWDTFSHEQRVAYLREVIARDVQPYVQLDEGGVDVKELRGTLEVVIEYQGNCITCYSSIGSTLNAIQQILRAKVHPDLKIIPDSSLLGAHNSQ